jgi:hypothetical protein
MHRSYMIVDRYIHTQMYTSMYVYYHHSIFIKYFTTKALMAWYSGIVSTCGAMGREIESRQGIGW